MTDELIFYHNPLSRGRIAHWMLEEVGVSYRIELLRFDRNDQKRPEYLALNPMGKIPTLVHRGTVVTEVAAICAYLADVYPEARLAPALGDPSRGSYLRWLFFAAGCVEPALLDHSLKRAPGDARTVGYGSYDDVLSVLERAISPGPYLLGEHFSAADVYIGSQVGWGLMTKCLEPRPAFQAYTARFADRPAFQRMVAQNAALAQKMKEAAAPSC